MAFFALLLVLVLVGIVVALALWWSDYQRQRRTVFNYIKSKLDNMQLCQYSESQLEKAAVCTQDALQQKYGMAKLLKLVQKNSSKFNAELILVGTPCVTRYCLVPS